MTIQMKWSRFLDQAQKDAKHWLFCMAMLFVFRIIFIVTFRKSIGPEAGWTDYIACLTNGFRFDAKPASIWVMLVAFGSIACGFYDISRIVDRVRYGFAFAFAAITTVMCRVAIGYYEEYNNIFDHWIFGMIYDDAGAVATTVLDQYNIPLNIFLGAAVIAGLVLFLLRFLKEPFVSSDRFDTFFEPRRPRIIAGVIIAVLLIAGARGTFGFRPLQPLDAAVTPDEFLNKAVVNPYMALTIAIGEQRQLSHTAGINVYLKNGDVASAAAHVFGRSPGPRDLDSYMLRRASGRKGIVPEQIFVIVVESHDSWPYIEKYRSLGLTQHTAELARDGILLRRFLPASDGTMGSFASIVTSIQDAGVRTNYQKTSREPYPSSAAPIFERLGYKTRVFYSGFVSWQRIGDFCRDQGFDEVLGGGHMGTWVTSNEWGVSDEDLYKFIGTKLDPGERTFNLILTTSNHPPYDIDVYDEGYQVRDIPEDIAPFWEGRYELTVLGHLWYADRAVARFVKATAEKLPKALFVITGDHHSRRFINSAPTYYERSSVPLVLYGSEVLEGLELPSDAVGSHLDLLPTVVEIAAPAGFEYHAMGRDIFRPAEHQISFARGKAITPTHVLNLGLIPAAHPIRWVTGEHRQPDLAAAKRTHDCLSGVAWWRVMKGPELPRSE